MQRINSRSSELQSFAQPDPPQVDALPPSAHTFSDRLRQVAVLAEKALGSLAISCGLLAAGGVVNSLYQRQRASYPWREAFLLSGSQANADKIGIYDDCIAYHLQPAHIPGTPSLINGTVHELHDHPGINPAESLKQCVQTVGSLLTHETFIHNENALTAWRQDSPLKLSQWAMAGAAAACTMAVLAPVALNYCARALESRARRLQATAVAADAETAGLVTLPNVQSTARAHAEVLTEKAREWMRRGPEIWMLGTGTSFWIALLAYVGVKTSGQLKHLHPDTTLLDLQANFASTDTLAVVASRLHAYKAGRQKSLRYAQTFELAASSSVAGCLAMFGPAALIGLAFVPRALQEATATMLNSNLIQRSHFLRNLPGLSQLISLDNARRVLSFASQPVDSSDASESGESASDAQEIELVELHQ